MIIILLTWFFMMVAAIGLILFLIGLVLKLRNKKKKAIVPTILMVLGALFMAPFLIMWIYSIYGTANIVDRRAGSLMHQVEFGTVEDVERLLAEGAPAESDILHDDGNVMVEAGGRSVFSFITYASRIPERSEKMQLLIDYGADIERRVYKCDGTRDEHASENDYENPDGCGTTPLMMACRAGVLEAVEVLLENGADVNAVDHYGKTPLVYVVECKSTLYPEDIQVEIVKLLLEYGADKEVVGRYNDTALEEAREREKYLIEQVLLEE